MWKVGQSTYSASLKVQVLSNKVGDEKIIAIIGIPPKLFTKKVHQEEQHKHQFPHRLGNNTVRNYNL